MSKVSNTLTMLRLLESGKKYSVKELAEKLEVSPRMIKLLFMSGGGKENMGCVEAAKKIKEQLGMNAVGYESEGTAHEFHTWRRSLHEFAQLLFK